MPTKNVSIIIILKDYVRRATILRSNHHIQWTTEREETMPLHQPWNKTVQEEVRRHVRPPRAILTVVLVQRQLPRARAVHHLVLAVHTIIIATATAVVRIVTVLTVDSRQVKIANLIKK